MSFLLAVLAFILVLGPLVLVHEFGHYAVAKLCGVRVEVFSIGFGKRLFGFKRGDTDYRVSLLPLGGYVRMSGENPMEESTGDAAEFSAHPRWQRFLIAIAGPVMNILLAIAAITALYMVHYERPYAYDKPAVIGAVEENSPAAQAGLATDDRIVRVEGIENPNWEQVRIRELISGGQPLEIAVQHGQVIRNLTLTPLAVGENRAGFAGWDPATPPIVGELATGGPAARAGIQAGDRMISVNGVPLRYMTDLTRTVRQSKDKPVTLIVNRGGKELQFTLTAVLESDGLYHIGIWPLIVVDKLSFSAALSKSLQQNKEFSTIIIVLLKRLVVHPKSSIRQMSGPIGIAQISSEALQAGWQTLIHTAALISINLGIFNLLPIPILDGGLILLLLIESVLRRDIKREVKELVYQAAFVLIVLFAVVVIYNDITKLPGVGKYLP